MKDDMIFLSNSIDSKEKDIIGFDTYVEKLNSAIDKNAQMIAITSPFGSGKTSIIEFLVTITDEFVETRQLAKRITAEKFEIGNWKFIKCAYEVKK